ncbi:hypothetical protein QTJ16_006242 [Diplocarpon rosae]|nr:hypothetical protein QTJ16_006242 [Diplocarpon rosae]
MASLWKKSISKGRFKSAEDTPSKDMNSDPRLSSTPTPRSKQKARPRIPLSFTKPMTAKTPSAGSPDTSTAMSNSPNKRMRTNESVDSAPAGDRRMAELDEITDAMRKIRPTTFLVQRNIIVHLIGPKFSESESIAVGIGALVIEECAFAKPEDIRPEHLGWRIFCEILRDMDSNCFIQNGGLRDPDDPLVLLDPIDQLVLEYESPSERGRIGIIDNEIQWQRAIGILEFYVEVDGRDRDIHFVARG